MDSRLPSTSSSSSPLPPLPAGDLLAQLPVELAEVLLHLAEVRPAAPARSRRTAGSGRAALTRRAGHLAGLDPGDLLVELRRCRRSSSSRYLRVRLGAEDHLPEQVEDRVQPRLGADELARLQAPDPLQRLLDRGRGVVVRLVGALGVVLAQPADLRGRPVVQVGPGGLGEPSAR